MPLALSCIFAVSRLVWQCAGECVLPLDATEYRNACPGYAPDAQQIEHCHMACILITLDACTGVRRGVAMKLHCYSSPDTSRGDKIIRKLISEPH